MDTGKDGKPPDPRLCCHGRRGRRVSHLHQLLEAMRHAVDARLAGFDVARQRSARHGVWRQNRSELVLRQGVTQD